MCGRYNLIPDEDAWADVGELLGEDVLAALRAIAPRYNISPGQKVPIIVTDSDGRPLLTEARWGFVPAHWNKPELPSRTLNVRSEEAATKPMWQRAWRHQRCLIPASGWYEWFVLEDGSSKPPKVPHHIRRQDGKHILFAGVWSVYRGTGESAGRPTCAVATIASPPSIARIHARTPVVLQPEFWRDWIDPAITDPERVGGMVQRGAARLFEMQTLGPEIGNSANEGPGLIARKPRPEADQSGLVIDDSVLNWLRRTPADELRRAIAGRLDESLPPSSAERRLWIRQIEDRDDSESLADLMGLIRDSLRSPIKARKSRSAAKDTPQGSLF